MIPLTAREALSPQVERVTATMRPSELEERKRGSWLCAVFGEEDEAFLGLVAGHASASFPNRIFADLLAEPRPAPVAAENPIETVFHRMAAEGVEAIPVLDENRAFLGVITWPSLLETLLRRERELLAEAQCFQGQLEAEQKRLVAWSKRQEELNEASRALLDLVGQTALERELLQEAIQALATLLQARYGAIGILDEASGLQQFHFAGLTPEEADRIGAHPLGRGLLGVIIREDETLRLADLTQDPCHAGFPPYHPPMKSLLAVPISHQDTVYGRVYLCDKTTGEPFTEDDERLAVSFARSLALALANAGELAERERAEEALQASELWLRAIFNSQDDTVLVVTPDRTILDMNTPAEKMFGYSVEEVKNRSTEILHVDRQHYAEFGERIQAAFAREEVARLEFQAKRKNGEIFPTEHTVSLLKNHLGGPIGIVSVVKDITERKRAEEALRESEDRYRDLVEHSHDLICTHDLEGNILSVNQQAGTVLGCDPSELLMKNIRDFLVPEVRDEFDAYLVRIRSDGAASGLMQVQTILGERRVWEYNNTLRTEGVAAPIVRGVARDITERKRAEQALRESEERYRELGESISDVFFAMDTELKYTYWNKASENLTGISAKDAIGKTLYQLFPEIEGTRAEKSYLEVLGTQQPQSLVTNYRVKAEDLSFETNAYPSKGGLSVFCKDITVRRRAEEALRKSEETHRMLVQNINEIVYLVRTEDDPFAGTVQLVGDQVENIIGYRPDEFLQDPGLWFRLIHPDDVPAVAETTQKMFARKEPVTRMYRVRHKETAEYRWMEDKVVPQIDDRGNVIGIFGVARDITERMRAEETLRQSQQNYEGLVSSIDGIVWEADARTLRFSFVSQQAERLLGYPVERWLAEPTFWRDHIHPDDREWAVAICETATREKRAHDFEYRMTASDGRTVWLRDIVTVVVEHDQAVKLQGVMVDITDWKRAEATRHALYEASLAIQEPMGLEDRLDRLLQTARDVLHLDRLNILLADPEGQWLEGVAALGTKEPAEAMRVPITPEGGGVAQAYLSQQPVIWADSQAPVPEAIRLQHPYNRLEAFRSRAFALLPLVVQGRAIGVMGADRKHTRRPLDPALLPLLQLFAGQAAIAIENSRLFEQVRDGRERLRTLSHQLVEIQEAERQHIARELHDEIGQALTGLKLSLEMSKHVPPDAIRPRLDEALELVNELMAHARDLSLDLRPAMLDDLGLLPTLLWHFDRYTAQTGIQVTFKHTGLERRFAPQIETAAYRIVQEALTNVARHAGVSEVMVQLWADQDKLEARIEDRGAGFDPRAALATSATSGLAGMRERTVSLGGQLTVESSPGIGTHLTGEFPLGAPIERRERKRDAQDGDRAGG